MIRCYPQRPFSIEMVWRRVQDESFSSYHQRDSPRIVSGEIISVVKLIFFWGKGEEAEVIEQGESLAISTLIRLRNLYPSRRRLYLKEELVYVRVNGTDEGGQVRLVLASSWHR